MSAPAIRFCLMLAGGLAWGCTATAQSPDYPYINPGYDFICYDSNRIILPGKSDSWELFLDGFSKLVRNGDEQLSIVHIGGSHLQADIYSDRVRHRFQTFQPGINAGRGMVFPYTVAKTNNPSNYRVKYNGRWTSCKNTEESRSCILGLTGISVTTRDTTATISIEFPEENEIPYDFNRVRIFYMDDSLLYHSIGVNGAKIPSFLRCSLFPDHLSSLSPDLVILTLGTNDAHTRYFNPQTYLQNYNELIRTIRRAVPEACIPLTVPNDSYLYRRYINRNTAKARDVIMELADQYIDSINRAQNINRTEQTNRAVQ